MSALAGGPHLPRRGSVRQLMLEVLLALLPGVAVMSWMFGWGVLVQVIWCAALGWIIEAACLALQQVPARRFLTDGSAPLAGVLLALCLPPSAPWWIGLLGMLFAIGLAKHLYGGLGHNLFNPAMAGYAAVLISFPAELAAWPAPHGFELGLGETISRFLQAAPAVDAIAQATPLDATRNLLLQGLTIGETLAHPMTLAAQPGHWQILALAYAAGGGYLLARGIIGWQAPVGVLMTVLLLSGLMHGWDADRYTAPMLQLGSGGLVLAAFFIATDPVTGCTTPRGRLLFGGGVGALCVLIRQFGVYPDGIAFAVLLMNAAAPWIDLHTRPRILGTP